MYLNRTITVRTVNQPGDPLVARKGGVRLLVIITLPRSYRSAGDYHVGSLVVEDRAQILQSTKRSLIQQFRKLVGFHGADLVFTDAAVREIAKIAPVGGAGT